MIETGGPKRIEVTLKDDKLDTKKKIVVTGLQAPMGTSAFYALTGRVWNSAYNDETIVWLNKDASTTWSWATASRWDATSKHWTTTLRSSCRATKWTDASTPRWWADPNWDRAFLPWAT